MVTNKVVYKILSVRPREIYTPAITASCGVEKANMLSGLSMCLRACIA